MAKVPADKLKETFLMHRDDGLNLEQRIIQIVGEIGEDTNFDFVDSALTVLEAKSSDSIIVRINSGGGDIYEALAIVGRMRSSKCEIVTEGYGQIMSAAVLILACGDRRYISPYCISMHHESSNGHYGTTSQVKEAAAQMEKEEELWAEWMEKFTAWSKEDWLAIVKKTNYYMSAEEVVICGMADELLKA